MQRNLMKEKCFQTSRCFSEGLDRSLACSLYGRHDLERCWTLTSDATCAERAKTFEEKNCLISGKVVSICSSKALTLVCYLLTVSQIASDT